MPARTGEQYIKGLQQQEREVWLGGERVKDVTTHPGLANGVRSVAALYDMQHDPTLRDEMTYVSPSSGDRVGLSFIIPRTKADFTSPLASDIEQYLATDTVGARDRVKLFRLAWDIAGSAFGSRQVLYERFFASDPLTRARILNTIYPKEEVTKRVLDFLARSDDTS